MSMKRLILFFTFILFMIHSTSVVSYGKSQSKGWSGSSYKSKSSSSYKSSSKSYKSNSSSYSSKSYSNSSSSGNSSSSNKSSNGWGSKSGKESSDKTAPYSQKDAASEAKSKSLSKENSKKAMQDYKNKQNKTAQQSEENISPTIDAAPPSVNKKYSNNNGYNYNHDTRTDRYNNHYKNWTPPSYAYRSAGGFGMWDAMFLYWMLSAGSNAFFYHHQNDPSVNKFIEEAKENSKENAELKQQLANLEKDMNNLKNNNTVVNKDYMPNNIDPDLAFDASYINKNKSNFYETPIPVNASSDKSTSNKSSGSSWGSKAVIGIILLAIYLIFIRKF